MDKSNDFFLHGKTKTTGLVKHFFVMRRQRSNRIYAPFRTDAVARTVLGQEELFDRLPRISGRHAELLVLTLDSVAQPHHLRRAFTKVLESNTLILSLILT